jgi:hypothetical protein
MNQYAKRNASLSKKATGDWHQFLTLSGNTRALLQSCSTTSGSEAIDAYFPRPWLFTSILLPAKSH